MKNKPTAALGAVYASTCWVHTGNPSNLLRANPDLLLHSYPSTAKHRGCCVATASLEGLGPGCTSPPAVKRAFLKNTSASRPTPYVIPGDRNSVDRLQSQRVDNDLGGDEPSVQAAGEAVWLFGCGIVSSTGNGGSWRPGLATQLKPNWELPLGFRLQLVLQQISGFASPVPAPVTSAPPWEPIEGSERPCKPKVDPVWGNESGHVVVCQVLRPPRWEEPSQPLHPLHLAGALGSPSSVTVALPAVGSPEAVFFLSMSPHTSRFPLTSGSS